MLRSEYPQLVGGRILEQHRRAYHIACGALLLLSILGIGISLWVHIDSLTGVGSIRGFEAIWIWQLILLLTYLPICVEVVWTKDYRHILKPHPWMRRVLWVLTAYYAGSFYLFIYRAADRLSTPEAWEMFSAGMGLAFAIAASHYATGFFRSKLTGEKKTSHSTLPSP
jgi:hypothetical protein